MMTDDEIKRLVDEVLALRRKEPSIERALGGITD
jgi:hypothetical protein